MGDHQYIIVLIPYRIYLSNNCTQSNLLMFRVRVRISVK